MIIVAGQSNAVGFGLTAADLPPSARASDPAVLIWNGAAFVEMRPGLNTGAPRQPKAWGPEVEFARLWRGAHPGQTLYIVKYARGSTSLAADPVEADWSPASGEHFKAASDQIARARSALAEAGNPYRLRAILWVQGEADAATSAKAAVYEKNLAAMFAQMRARWGDAPILFSQLSAETGLVHADLVRGAQARVDAADETAAMARVDGTPMQPDGLHYAGDGQIALGRALYDLYASSPSPE